MTPDAPTRGRWIALVGAIAGDRHTTQTTDFPLDPAQMLPLPDVVLLEVDDDPGAMLYRYTAYGELGGDSWHPDADTARAQAADEYDDALGAWEVVPAEVPDAHAFAVRYAADRLDERGPWSGGPWGGR